MADDTLAVWMDGQAGVAGHLLKGDDGETAFFYDAAYIARGGLPLSLSLPLETAEFGDPETRAYLANLLPGETGGNGIFKPDCKPPTLAAFCAGDCLMKELAGELGLEPRMTVPKTAVLPLHHSPAGMAARGPRAEAWR